MPDIIACPFILFPVSNVKNIWNIYFTINARHLWAAYPSINPGTNLLYLYFTSNSGYLWALDATDDATPFLNCIPPVMLDISYLYISPVILDISMLWMPPMMILHF